MENPNAKSPKPATPRPEPPAPLLTDGTGTGSMLPVVLLGAAGLAVVIGLLLRILPCGC